jgi:hypothetical protein
VPWNEKNQAYFWIAFYVAIPMKSLLPATSGMNNCFSFKTLTEPRHAALRRSVAIAAIVARRHYAKWRMTDEILNPTAIKGRTFPLVRSTG